MPTPISLLDYAQLCAAIYDSSKTSAAGFTRSGFTQRRSGFQGAYFSRPNGQGVDYVVTVAGTQPTDDLGADIVADLGFGAGLAPVARLLPVMGSILAIGQATLEMHLSVAAEMVRQALSVATRPGDRVLITGHSLGGGIAQIIAARTGIPAVGISAPAVTGVPGVLAAWQRTRAPIFCLRIRHDPINETGHIGSWLGQVQTLPSNRTGLDAHSIDKTVLELSPSGQFSTTGNKAPHG